MQTQDLPALQIDPEFQALLMPLSQDEREQLQALLIAHGCRQSLTVWNGTNPHTLIDGHNRYAICKEHGIEFSIVEMALSSREAVVDWIVRNQLGRRNVTAEQASYLRGKRYNAEKTPGHGSKSARHNDGQITSERLAEDFKVAPRTIERDGDFAKAVDTITELGGEEAREAVLSREAKLNRKDVKKIAKIAAKDEDRAREILARVMDDQEEQHDSAPKDAPIEPDAEPETEIAMPTQKAAMEPLPLTEKQLALREHLKAFSEDLDETREKLRDVDKACAKKCYERTKRIRRHLNRGNGTSIQFKLLAELRLLLRKMEPAALGCPIKDSNGIACQGSDSHCNVCFGEGWLSQEAYDSLTEEERSAVVLLRV